MSSLICCLLKCVAFLGTKCHLELKAAVLVLESRSPLISWMTISTYLISKIGVISVLLSRIRKVPGSEWHIEQMYALNWIFSKVYSPSANGRSIRGKIVEFETDVRYFQGHEHFLLPNIHSVMTRWSRYNLNHMAKVHLFTESENLLSCYVSVQLSFPTSLSSSVFSLGFPYCVHFCF